MMMPTPNSSPPPITASGAKEAGSGAMTPTPVSAATPIAWIAMARRKGMKKRAERAMYRSRNAPVTQKRERCST